MPNYSPMRLVDIPGQFQQGRMDSYRNKLAEIGIQREQNAMQNEAGIKNTLSQFGSVTPDGRGQYLNKLASMGQQGLQTAQQVQKMWSEMDSQQQALFQKGLEEQARLLSIAKDPESYQAARNIAIQMNPAFEQQIPPNYDPNWVDFQVNRVREIEDILNPGGGLPVEMQTFNSLTEGLSPDDRERARRIELGLDPRAVGSAPKNVMIAGVPHVFDPATRSYVPAAINGDQITAQDVASDKATIAKEEAAAKAEGKAVGEAKSQVAQDVANADEMITLLDMAISHPGLDEAVGFSSVINPVAAPGTDRKNFLVLLDQLTGKTFLQAFQSLKGGGQITEVEGRKATEAIARLNTAQSEEEFKSALNELKGIVERGKQRAKQKAGVSDIDDLVNKYAD